MCVLLIRIRMVGFVPVATVVRVVSLVWRGTGMVSDRTEVIVVPSILVRSVRRARSCQGKHTGPRSISPCHA
jgi:hypothetical protein